MNQGTKAHIGGDYDQALQLRLTALDAAGDPVDIAHAQRDISASYDRLGKYDEALDYAQQAVDTHRAINKAEPSADAVRELGASEMYVAIAAYRGYRHLDNEDGVRTTVINSDLSMFHIDYAERKSGEKPDQYRINLIGRAAMFEGLFGRKRRALKLGGQAVKIALKSESPKLSTSTPELSKKERAKAKVKALTRSLGSLAVAALATPKSKSSRRQKAALSLTDKLI
jgi:tetratricopeptide (TPR) repeat protein